jgi:NAD(P)-dependent dehydrogenase (short-subunit alcohol dehydrogenase family)
MDLFSLTGKRILVTGGTRGIGRAISLRFAKAGASVIANYVRDEGAAQELAAMAEKEGLSIGVCRADLTGQKGLGRLEEFLGNPDTVLSGMVYSSATGVHGSIDELTTRHFDWTFALNVRAFFEVTKLLLPRFVEGSSIVALSSEGALHAMPSYSLVGSSKGALESLARHFAAELAPKGIRVNILSPGAILTGAWDKMPDREVRLAAAIERSPMGRLCSPEEVAWAAQFLCSDASSGIVGHTLVVDGGARIAG